MPERLLEVNLEFNPKALEGERNVTQVVAEASKRAAEDKAVEQGGTLRHPDPRSVLVKKAMTYLGDEVLLVSTRWLVDLPVTADV